MDAPKDQNLTGLSPLIQQVVQVCKIKFNGKLHRKFLPYESLQHSKLKEKWFESVWSPEHSFSTGFWATQNSVMNRKQFAKYMFLYLHKLPRKFQNCQSSLSVMRLRMKFSQLALISEQDAGKQLPCQAVQRLKLYHSRRLVHTSQTSIISNSQIQLQASQTQSSCFTCQLISWPNLPLGCFKLQ